MLALIMLSMFVTCIVPSLVALRLIPRTKARTRYAIAVFLFTLFVTPSFIAGDMISLPVPFGAVLVASAISWRPTLVTWTLDAWPVWHAVSFPVTALLGALIFIRARPRAAVSAGSV